MVYTSKQHAAAREMYDQLAERQLLALMETLRRHDENVKAHLLMSVCVPYFLQDRPAIQRAREECQLNVLHILDPTAYEAYYAANRHERPFEEQFKDAMGQPATVETADLIARVGWLIDQLTADAPAGGWRLLELGANDGWMLAHLQARGLASPDSVGVDLNVGCVERAKGRGVDVRVGRVEAPPVDGPFDAVACFEVLEHVTAPVAVLSAARELLAPGGRVFCSTPLGAVEGGLIDWVPQEAKGHVRAVTPDDFVGWLAAAGLVLVGRVSLDEDGLMLAEAVVQEPD